MDTLHIAAVIVLAILSITVTLFAYSLYTWGLPNVNTVPPTYVIPNSNPSATTTTTNPGEVPMFNNTPSSSENPPSFPS